MPCFHICPPAIACWRLHAAGCGLSGMAPAASVHSRPTTCLRCSSPASMPHVARVRHAAYSPRRSPIRATRREFASTLDAAVLIIASAMVIGQSVEALGELRRSCCDRAAERRGAAASAVTGHRCPTMIPLASSRGELASAAQVEASGEVAAGIDRFAARAAEPVAGGETLAAMTVRRIGTAAAVAPASAVPSAQGDAQQLAMLQPMRALCAMRVRAGRSRRARSRSCPRLKTTAASTGQSTCVLRPAGRAPRCGDAARARRVRPDACGSRSRTDRELVIYNDDYRSIFISGRRRASDLRRVHGCHRPRVRSMGIDLSAPCMRPKSARGT